ncbi:MAG: FAD-linked oxidase C-terminal domain-containing protein [Desulfatiglans sp.]|jgi:glycolate oxidase|nr:FAD-linked oxidase C-terminal domain-containing protein [Thermodesulfobacteriota bacterium]MEE4354063.1 FAD-linked oxidase C-terminal domain-containing protein [Desulfatiglans sp.]
MIPKSVLKEISHIVGQESLKISRDVLNDYASDATELRSMPHAVVFPKNENEISRILGLATLRGFAVIPRGAGSGMSGGAIPVKGGLVVAMGHFDRILEIDKDNLICKVEPGVITADLQKAVEEVGLFYPPDPASVKISTIGGNVAECAGGLRAVKYGVTRDYVLGLTVVLPTGEILKTGVETMKGVAGYDLTRLIIGSEGTLAVITSITLRLIPKPDSHKTMIAFFLDVASAVRTVTEIIRDRISPSILEFMDRRCIDCVREEMDYPIHHDAGAMLLIEIDDDRILLDRKTDRIKSICHNGGALSFEQASTREESERLWEARRNVSPSLMRLKPHKISEDIVVPRNLMPDLVTYLKDLELKYDLPTAAFGHAGDGNIHVNVMLDKENDQEMESARHLIKELFKKVVKMRGTITGEHGIGITKAPYLDIEIPRAGMELMRGIKKVFDPRGILNPGKMGV